jgi:transcriptional regulator
MNITLTIQEADYGFVVEAIKLRTTSMLESLDNQVARQQEEAKLIELRKQAFTEAGEEPWEVEHQEEKIIASMKENSRTAVPRSKVRAPYGLKKDGTPKKRPGRTPS